MPYQFFDAGVGLVDKSVLNANFLQSQNGGAAPSSNNLTAKAGGGQSGATQIVPGTNRYTTVATTGDSAQLPLASGQRLIVINASANAMNVFGFTGSSDTINGTAGTTAYALAAGKVAEFISAGAGVWNVLLSA